MFSKSGLFVLLVLNSVFGQRNDPIYFPNQNNFQYAQTFRPVNTNLHNQASLQNWRNHVNNIIYNGLAALTNAFGAEIERIYPNDDNTIMSPVCISEILTLLLLGSNGTTKQEIANVLGLATGIDFRQHSNLVHQEMSRLLQQIEASSNEVLTAITASALFVQDGYPISEEYKRDISNVYHSEIQSLNFRTNSYQALSVVNDWVSRKTFGKIPIILDALPNHVRVILLSTLYFKGDWETPFGSLSKRRLFYPDGVSGNSRVYVDLMPNAGSYMYYKDTSLNCQIIGIPYKGNSTVFYVIQPLNSNKQNLRRLKANLSPQNIERLISQMNPTNIILLMPKMTLTQTISLKGVLRDLNVHTLFDSQRADLSNMFSYDRNTLQYSENLYIDDVVHKVQMEVTEAGTIGSAVTVALVAKKSGINVKLDTPFVFFIRNEPTRLNLFWGSVEKPTPNYATAE